MHGKNMRYNSHRMCTLSLLQLHEHNGVTVWQFIRATYAQLDLSARSPANNYFVTKPFCISRDYYRFFSHLKACSGCLTVELSVHHYQVIPRVLVKGCVHVGWVSVSQSAAQSVVRRFHAGRLGPSKSWLPQTR